jgi:hypothetical protein
MARKDLCKHFMVKGKCDDWVMSKIKDQAPISDLEYSSPAYMEVLDEICFDCGQYERKGRPFFSKKP